MRQKEGDGDGGGGGAGGGELTMVRNDSADRVREMQLSIAASSSVFPGFRFSPTDDELISYYLKKKLQGCDNCVDIIPEVDFCRHEPWDLPGLSIIRSDNEWFFFSARGKKYPNGSQSKRATQSGYWKATGKERNVKSGDATIGTKRTLVFHTGRAPKGERTEWIMHEYCMSDTSQEALVVCRLRRNGDFRLNESSRSSSDRRISSTTYNDNLNPTATNESANNTQIDGDAFDDGNALKSCSMESTSSYRSHSVEQNGPEPVSCQQHNSDPPDGGFSTPYKEGNDEDDCFADIINDDIIQLDESASRSLTVHGVLAGTMFTETLPQETMSAVRRITQRDQKHETRPTPPLYGYHNNQTSDNKESGCVFGVLTGNANALSKFHPAYLALLFFFVVVVAWKGNYMDARQYLGIGMEASRRQLRCWLRRAAEYI